MKKKKNEHKNIQDFFSDDIEKADLLTAEEEVELSKKIREGDIEARNKLVNANIRFVFKIAGKYTTHGSVTYEDLVASGLEGLIYAAEKFDPDKGNRFTTYAYWWIGYGIKKYLNEMVPHLRVPIGQIQRIRALHRELVARNQTLKNNDLIEEDLARERGEDALRVKAVKDAFSVILYDEDVNNHIIENYSKPTELPKDKKEEKEKIFNIALSAISFLPELHQDIVKRYFGIDCDAQTLQHISQIYLLSRERIRQLKDESLSILSELTEGNLLFSDPLLNSDT